MVGICVQEKEMEKQKLLYQQARLHDRGAAEMVLQTISASKGEALYLPWKGWFFKLSWELPYLYYTDLFSPWISCLWWSRQLSLPDPMLIIFNQSLTEKSIFSLFITFWKLFWDTMLTNWSGKSGVGKHFLWEAR